MQTLSKITSPQLSAPLERKRLFKLLDSSCKKPVVWLSAPAGSGKTTLVASWLDKTPPVSPSLRKRGKGGVIWYSVDTGDADIASFFYYMGMAAKKAAPRHKKPLPLLTSEYLADIPTFTRRYFENLFGRLTPLSSPLKVRGDERGVIVLDNYQNAPADSPFHGMIADGFDVIPEGINVIVISRNEPPPEFARLIANNKIAGIGWDEIKFNLKETERFIKGHGSSNKGQEITRQLRQQTDGWVAGMILMMEDVVAGLVPAQSGRPQRSPLQQHETVFNYFAAEIFNKTDKATQDFLLKTAFLSDMTAEIAQRLTGLVHSEKILSGLNRNNYFCQKQYAQRPVYRYHPLFREFLLNSAVNVFTSEKIADIRKNAAVILEQSGQTEEAADIFMAVGDFESLIKLILNHARSLAAEGRYKTLEKRITSIPPDILTGAPWLLYWLGVCRMVFHPAKGREMLERAFDGFSSQGDHVGTLLSWSCIVNCIWYEQEDFKESDRWIEWLKEWMREHRLFPSLEIEAQVTCSLIGVLLFRQPRRSNIHAWIERLLRIFQQTTDVGMKVQTGFHLAFYYLWLGDIARGSMVIEEMGVSANFANAPPLHRLTWMICEGYYHWCRISPERCLETVSAAIALSDASGVHLHDFWFYCFGVYSALSIGDLAMSAEFLSKGQRLLGQTGRLNVAHHDHLVCWQALMKGDIATAAFHGERSVRLSTEAGTPFPEAVCRLGMAQALFEHGEYSAAEAHLERAFEVANSMKSLYLEFICQIVRAHFSLSAGDEAQAIDALRRAMALGRKQGYWLCAWWRHAVMSMLCAKALEHGIETEYVEMLIRKRNLMPEKSVENWPYPVKIYTLDRFEILIDGKPLEFSGKVQKKPLEMLKTIIDTGGEDVPVEKIADKLWPDADGDKAHSNFEMTLSRLRKLIGGKSIELKGGMVSLNPRMVWVDKLPKKAANRSGKLL